MQKPLSFFSIYQPRVWGGNFFRKSYRRVLPEKKIYGESWEICDRGKEQSRVQTGKWKGYTLGQLWKEQREQIFGEKYTKITGDFPLLIKILDTRENLSVQVHPPKSKTPVNDSLPKDEFWYVIHSEKKLNACIYAGTNSSEKEIRNSMGRDSLVSHLEKFTPEPHDFIEIPAGTIHALGKGLVVFEIQANSDTTYRLYDWERKGKEERELHLKKGLDSIHFNSRPILKKSEPNQLLANGKFGIFCREEMGEFTPRETSAFCILMIIEGEISEKENQRWSKGDTILIPQNSCPLSAKGKTRFLEITLKA